MAELCMHHCSPGVSVVRYETIFCLTSNLLLQEESGLDVHEALDGYQQCLGELLLALAGR